MDRSVSTAMAGLLAAVLLMPVVGGSAPAVAAGSTGAACTILGTARADRLVGTPGADVICGGGGDDVLIGRAGDDVLRGGTGADRLGGGPGDDTESGGAGSDTLLGAAGDDDLDGGPEADDIDGGAGSNLCSVDLIDTATLCVYDLQAPDADQVTVSTGTVDVTYEAQSVVVQVHVTDDTGVETVRVLPGESATWLPSATAVLTSGTPRDGWWTATLDFHPGLRPGTVRPLVALTDRVEKVRLVRFDAPTISVLDAVADADPPVITLISPTADETFDATSGDVEVTIRERVMDASGVCGQVEATVWQPRSDSGSGYGRGATLHLEAGDTYNGIWAGTVTIPRGSVGGRWNLELRASDCASVGVPYAHSVYWGPDLYPLYADQYLFGRYVLINDGLGIVNVVGRQADREPPTVSEVQLSPTVVDTLASSATVDVTVHAADPAGVDDVRVALVPANGLPWERFETAYTKRVDGTVQDGTWRGSITLPQGLPPGVYYTEVTAWDADRNSVGYLGSGHPNAPWAAHLLETNPTVTVVDSRPGG